MPARAAADRRRLFDEGHAEVEGADQQHDQDRQDKRRLHGDRTAGLVAEPAKEAGGRPKNHGRHSTSRAT